MLVLEIEVNDCDFRCEFCDDITCVNNNVDKDREVQDAHCL